MKFIQNNSLDPYYNLAFEEYVFHNYTDDDYILLWQNQNAIIVGKHQNAVEEINQEAVLERGTKVVRRMTGGGAVYHDLGNLNFSFMSEWNRESDLNYERFLIPVIHCLEKFGVKAEKAGRNDLVAEGCKISGNAQAIYRNRILHHGTILFDSNLDVLANALRVDKAKIQSKGVKSVRSRVTNVKELLPEQSKNITIGDFKNTLLASFFEQAQVEEVVLTDNDLVEIDRLCKEKYSTWDWNFGLSPVGNYEGSNRFPGGKMTVTMRIEGGYIKICRILGDFLSLLCVSDIENALRDKKYDSVEIRKVLEDFNLKHYFGSISLEECMSCFI